MYTHTHKTMFLQTQENITKISIWGSTERTHQIRALVVKSGDLTSVLVTHEEVGEKQLLQAVL